MMRSEVVHHVAEKRTATSQLVLKRGRQQLLAADEGGPEKNARAAGDDSLLVVSERAWFAKRLQDGLASAHRHLENASPWDGSDKTFGGLVDLTSLEEVMAQLSGDAVKFFRLAYSDEEWEELQQSSQAVVVAMLQDSDAGQLPDPERVGSLRTLQLKRQRQLLETLCESAIDLTVCGSRREAGMQSELVHENMTFVSTLLDRVGMNPRGTVRRLAASLSPSASRVVAVVGAPSPAAADASEEEGPGEENVPVVVATTVKEKAKSNSKKRVTRDKDERRKSMRQQNLKRKAGVTSEEPSNEEEDDNEDDVVFALQPDVDEVPSNPKENDEIVELILQQAAEDVPVVATMIQESAVEGGVQLKVGQVTVPDSGMATESAGGALLKDVARLEAYLSLQQHDGDGALQAVERWGVLLRWWRTVSLAYAIVGIMTYLRNQKRTTRSIQERFTNHVSRLKGGKVALSYQQAMKYKRLGQFLLRFPRFVFQLQLVTLADWSQKVGDDDNGPLLLDAMEKILDIEQLQARFWSLSETPLLAVDEEDVDFGSAVEGT